MNQRESQALDNYITGHYGEDQFRRRLVSERHSYLVAIYEVDKAYGGPEEGDWWYDRGTLVRVVRVFPNEDRAREYCTRLNARLRSRSFGPNAGRRELSSVLSEGEYQAHLYEDFVPRSFPDSRPRFE